MPIQNNPLKRPIGAQLSPAITSNTTTTINVGSAAIFAGAVVNTAGSAWNVEIYNGVPGSGGVLMATFPADTQGLVPSPPLNCPQGIYAVTAGTTAGSVSIAYFN
ncbi:MAG: hypothetical protein GJU73_05325 [Ferrovum sp.]|jgi:predicted S18 family serine protease|uniref:hypothetical protein n=1 Tax=Ferrovum sp. TaxID=2609467 RepID=UPI002618771F|nr:hypothetical protein [Ferrovum sp.]MBW8066850.1 hypothetical protein [Ferrovum sp.]